MKDVLTNLGYSGTKHFPEVILQMVDVGASVSGVTDIGPHIISYAGIKSISQSKCEGLFSKTVGVPDAYFRHSNSRNWAGPFAS